VGVIVSDDLKNSEAVKKANRILGMIKQNFTKTRISLYKTLVKPHVEYCSQERPHYGKNIQLIDISYQPCHWYERLAI